MPAELKAWAQAQPDLIGLYTLYGQYDKAAQRITRGGLEVVSLAAGVGAGIKAAKSAKHAAKTEAGTTTASGAEVIANVPGANFERIISQVSGRTIHRADALNPGALGNTVDSVAATFSGGRYASIELTEDLIVYRAWTPGQSREFGGFWTIEKPVGSLQTRIDSALTPEWGRIRGTSFHSQATDYTAIRVPAGSTIHVGEVGGQGGTWVGGGSQVLIEGGPQEAWRIGGGKLK